MEQTSPFRSGAIVATYYTTSWGAPNPIKRVVEKVHKSGRFLLEGSDQQWTPSKYTPSEARESGKPYSSWICEIWAEKHDKMIVKARLEREWQDACDRVSKARRRTPEDASLVAELVALAERISPSEKS